MLISKMKWSFILATSVLFGAVLYGRFGDLSVFNGCGFVSKHELLISSTRIVTPEGIINGTIHVKDGRIHEIYEQGIGLPSSELMVLEYGDLVISPGIIDSHVEFSEPGFDEREGIRKGTKAASANGITTVLDFPLSSDPPQIITPQRLKAKVFRFNEEAYVHMGPIGGITPENCDHNEMLLRMTELGIIGFHSVMSRDDRFNLDPVNSTHLRSAVSIVMSLGMTYSIQIQQEVDPWTPESEISTIKSLIALLKDLKTLEFKSGFRIHFTDIRVPESISIIQEVKKDLPFPVGCELSAPVLYFASRDDENPLLKMYPPLGTDSSRRALLQTVIDGLVDIIVSGHSPRTPEEKFLPYKEAYPGISGIQYLLPSVWTNLKRSNVDLMELSQLLSTGPAQLFKLENRTGSIRKGLIADLMVWDPDAVVDTSLKGAYSEHPQLSPYIHTWLQGEVKATWVKGNLIYTKERGHSLRSCPTIYALGSWAKTVVFWFYEFNFASKL